MTTPVGFVGLGRIGKPIAANILAAGFELMVFDVREEPMRELSQLGAKQASGLRELGDHAEIIGVAVVDDSQVEEVVLSDAGLLQSGRNDSIIMIHSTHGHARHRAQVGASRGAQRGEGHRRAGERGRGGGAGTATLLYGRR